MRRKIIDAEFTVIREGSAEPPRSWNGLGIHPNWPEWNLAGKITYVVLYAAGLVGLWLLHHWLMGL